MKYEGTPSVVNATDSRLMRILNILLNVLFIIFDLLFCYEVINGIIDLAKHLNQIDSLKNLFLLCLAFDIPIIFVTLMLHVKFRMGASFSLLTLIVMDTITSTQSMINILFIICYIIILIVALTICIITNKQSLKDAALRIKNCLKKRN